MDRFTPLTTYLPLYNLLLHICHFDRNKKKKLISQPLLQFSKLYISVNYMGTVARTVHVFTVNVKCQDPSSSNLGNMFWTMTIWKALCFSNQYFHIWSMAPVKSHGCHKYFSGNEFLKKLNDVKPQTLHDLHKTDLTAAFQFYSAVM